MLGTQVIKQPDGRFALFSSVTGTIVLADATADGVIDFFLQERIEDTRHSISRAIDHVADDNAQDIYLDDAMTWQQAQEQDRRHGGEYSRGEIAEQSSRYIVIDNSEECSLGAALDKLSLNARTSLLNALKAIQEREVQEFLLKEIRAELNSNYFPDAAPVGVVFYTREVNGANFLDSVGSVLFNNGIVRQHAFGNIRTTLETFYSYVPTRFTLAVDVATGTFDVDVSGSAEPLYERLGRMGCVVPQPPDGTLWTTLKLLALPEEKILYLARSCGQRLKERGDAIYQHVADENTSPAFVTNVAAWIALENGWIDEEEHKRLIG